MSANVRRYRDMPGVCHGVTGDVEGFRGYVGDRKEVARSDREVEDRGRIVERPVTQWEEARCRQP